MVESLSAISSGCDCEQGSKALAAAEGLRNNSPSFFWGGGECRSLGDADFFGCGLFSLSSGSRLSPGNNIRLCNGA
jgi:hypothetical protein